MPTMKQRIAEPRDVRRLRVRLSGANLSSPDLQHVLQGVGQTVEGDIVELRDPSVAARRTGRSGRAQLPLA